MSAIQDRHQAVRQAHAGDGARGAWGVISDLKAPFPWFGGKRWIASEVWERLGNPDNFVEPFSGSAAMLLARPDAHAWWEKTETINDADGFVSNFWRAVQAEPGTVARWADWPVNENDLHARHGWLVARSSSVVARLEGDPNWYDAQVAGWWVWGICLWIGSGWCSGDGPWRQVDGQLVHLGDDGRGLCDAWSGHLSETMARLADRLRRVRVCCGDWSRVCGPTPTTKLGLTGVFLDPPYAHETKRHSRLYRREMALTDEVRQWAIERGDDPLMRIALAGYDDEHAMPDGWTRLSWSAGGGYASQGDGSNTNRHRETVWFSPHCVQPATTLQAVLPLEAV